MIDDIIDIDHAVSLTINYLHTDWLDIMMLAASERLTWIPLYLFILYVAYKSLGWKALIIFVVGCIITILLSDQVSVFMKGYFARLRPCHNLHMIEHLRMIVGCGGRYGFVSSHASNTMALAVVSSLIIKRKWFTSVMISYALINGYSRIYLGKHYVLDILGGYLLGLLIGWAIFELFVWYKSKYLNM